MRVGGGKNHCDVNVAENKRSSVHPRTLVQYAETSNKISKVALRESILWSIRVSIFNTVYI